MKLQKPQKFTLAALGLALSAIAGACPAPAYGSTSAHDQEAATVLADLIHRGHVLVDPATGNLILNKPVLQILESYGMATRTQEARFDGIIIYKPNRCSHQP